MMPPNDDTAHPLRPHASRHLQGAAAPKRHTAWRVRPPSAMPV